MLQRMLMFLIAVTSLSLGTVVAEIVPDFLMDTDPDCRPRPSTDVSPMPDHVRLWIEVLQRPETDYQRMAAESIALAHKKGVSDLDQAVPALETIVTAESSHHAARFAAARALIVINSRSSANKLLESSQMWGSDLKQLVEPALAEWDFQPIRPIWKERLEAVGQQPRRELLLAIRGVQRVRDTSVLPTLRQIVQDFVQPHDYRLAAAAAAGELAESGLEQDAEGLISEKRGVSVINRRCAVRLLRRHASEPARRSLIGLAGDDEPSLAAAALERLNEIDSNLVLPLAGAAMKNADANVRLQGGDCVSETADCRKD